MYRHHRLWMRAALFAIAGVGALLVSHNALAQFQVTAIHLDESVAGGGRLTDEELKRYFNRARCDCATPIRITVAIQPALTDTGKVKIVSGADDCLTTEQEIDVTNCREHFTGRIRDQNRDIEVVVPAANLMLGPGGSCDTPVETNITLHVLRDQGNEKFSSLGVQRTYPVDTQRPPQPIAQPDKPPQAGEGLVRVFFDQPEDSEANLKYQILCQRVEDPTAQPRTKSPETAAFDVPATLRSCDGVVPPGADGGLPGGDAGVDAAAGPDAGISPDAAVATDDAAVATDGGADLGAQPDAPVAPADASPAPLPDDALLAPKFVCSSGTSSSGSVTVGDLDQDVEYRFFVVSIDEVRNPSLPVDLGTGRPSLEEDLWERYKRSGGQAEPGCRLAPDPAAPAAAGLLLLAGLWSWRRLRRLDRRRRTAAPPRRRGGGPGGLAGLLVLLALLPRQAHAQMVETSDHRSPQNFAFEIKLGPYSPDIDSSFEGDVHPFADLFGDGTALMVRGELDWQILRGLGSLGVGLSVGYYGNSANALQDTGGPGQPSPSTERSAGETGIRLVPIALLAVYRFDLLADHLHVPLVPFVKFGFNYTLWWITQGDGSLANAGGDDALGGTPGLQFNAGLALRLDFLEPSSAKSLDNDMGINHSYVFFEFVHQRTDGFGSDTRLDVGDTTWQAGLAFEF